MYKDLFYFDIETTSQYKNISEMDKIGCDIFMKKMSSSDDGGFNSIETYYREKAPLFPEFGKIICMSFGVYDSDGNPQIRTVIDENEEKLMQKIKGIFDRVGKTNKRMCGFKIKSFDIPWIVRKMYKYNILLPTSIDFAGLKPWEIVVTDLYDIWRGGSNIGASLEEVCYALGIENPKIKMDGTKIYKYYWQDNDFESIMEYCEGDVKSVMSIAEKLKL